MSWQVHRGRLWLKCYQSNQLLQTTILRPGGAGEWFENNYDWNVDSFWTIEQIWLKALCIESRRPCKVSQSYKKKFIWVSVFVGGFQMISHSTVDQYGCIVSRFKNNRWQRFRWGINPHFWFGSLRHQVQTGIWMKSLKSLHTLAVKNM